MADIITISELKKNLGPGLGLRKNKYLLEVPLSQGRQINTLCQATSLPERAMSTTSVYFAGRKYNIRGETDYQGTYEISIVDDSSMSLRKAFDSWMYTVDNSNWVESSSDSTDIHTINDIPRGQKNAYQSDVSIWQIDSNGNKVYGYKLQNAFPSSVGTVALDDNGDGGLTEFSVVFTFSEFIPVSEAPVVYPDDVVNNTSQSNDSGFDNLFTNIGKNESSYLGNSVTNPFAISSIPGDFSNSLGNSLINDIQTDFTVPSEMFGSLF
jgi:hypothetical protein